MRFTPSTVEGYNCLMDDASPDIETKSPKEGSIGPLSATIVIVFILLVAGVYFLIQQERHIRALKLEEQQAQLPANS